jgi:glycosyltransferase involved in cell wall biosynthesis
MTDRLSTEEAAAGAIRIMHVIARMNVGGPALIVGSILRDLPPGRFAQRLYTGEVGADEADYLELCAPDLPAQRVPGLGRSVRPGDDALTLAHLARAMRRYRPHIVHTHTAKAGTLGRVAAAMTGVPARVHTFHGHLLHGYFSPAITRVVVGAERALARRTDRLVAVGTRVRDDLVAAGIGRSEQYLVIPPGIDLPPVPAQAEARSRLGLPPRAPVIAFVGRVTGIKRPDRLVDVARRVLARVPDAMFVVCGDGDRLGDLIEATADLDGAVRLLGWRTDVETVYAAADLTLLTSDNEGMPVSLIESGLAGVPVVATDVGSVAEVVTDGVTGLLASPAAEPELCATLAGHVIRLLGDQRLRQTMGRQARIHAGARFGSGRLIADTAELYTSLAIGKGWWRAAPSVPSVPSVPAGPAGPAVPAGPGASDDTGREDIRR